MTIYRGKWKRHADTADGPVQTLNVSETEGRTTNATSARTRPLTVISQTVYICITFSINISIVSKY